MAGAFTLLPDGIGLLLIQISLILIVTRILGGILKKHFKQPTVVAEVLAGIMLGKSLFGRIPGYMETLFPTSSLPAFSLLADLGLVLYLFLVGLELDPESIFKTGRAAIAIAVSGILVPFILAIAVAYMFQHFILQYDPDCGDVPFSTLAVFTGVGLSITAFPVLARILSESRLISHPVGKLALSAAAFNDAVAWVLLAISIALVDASQPITALYILLSIVGWASFLCAAVRPCLALIIAHVNTTRSRSWRNALLAIVFICIFLSSWFTDFCGTDPIFGAFLIGVILPRDAALIRVVEKIEDLVMVVFLPLYFTLSGLKTNVASINSLRSVGILALVLVVAVGGKLLACYAAAKALGVQQHESVAIGILMNTRGLVELIVLNIGLKSGVINEEVFTIMVLMALTTTFMTSPLIRRYYPKTLWEQQVSLAAAAAAAQQRTNRLRTLSLERTAESSDIPKISLFVPAYDAKTIINGLYMLLPNSVATPKVIVSSFIDLASTATVIGERVGAVRDVDAREILLAAKLFGAETEASQIIAPSTNISTQLIQLVREAAVDVALLPFAPHPAGTGGVSYELSMWKALPFVDPTTTFILYSDQGNMKMPCLMGNSRASSPRYVVCVLLYKQQQESVVIEVATLLKNRKDIALQVLVYKGVTQETAELLDQHKLPAMTVVSTEDELLGFFASSPAIDLLIYGFDIATPPLHVLTTMLASQSGATAAGGRRSIGDSGGGGFRVAFAGGYHAHHRRNLSSSSQATRPLLQDGNSLSPYYGLEGNESTSGRTGSNAAEVLTWTSRAVVERMMSRLASVHNKKLSIMEVHSGQASVRSDEGRIHEEETGNGAPPAVTAVGTG